MSNQQQPSPEWQQRVRAALDEKTDDLDYATQMALARARANALTQTESRWQQLLRRRNLWLGSAVPVALAVLFMLQVSTSGNMPTETHSVYEDLELLADGEELDTFSELDMYEWMSEDNKES